MVPQQICVNLHGHLILDGWIVEPQFRWTARQSSKHSIHSLTGLSKFYLSVISMQYSPVFSFMQEELVLTDVILLRKPKITKSSPLPRPPETNWSSKLLWSAPKEENHAVSILDVTTSIWGEVHYLALRIASQKVPDTGSFLCGVT